jgi:beta-glucanase (GH16 family)
VANGETDQARGVERIPMRMRAAFAAALLAVTGCAGGTRVSPSIGGGSDGRWSLVFSDEFDGTELGDGWNTCHWWQVDGGCTIASNDEQQWYRPEAVSVRDDVLQLTATLDPQTTTSGARLPYRSGMVTTGYADNDDTSAMFAFTYGYVEVRLRLPTGTGTWPAVWLLSADRESLPEIDLFEWYGSRPDVMTAHVHRDVDGERTSIRFDAPVVTPTDGWHVVGLDWGPDSIEFHLDGGIVGRVDDPTSIPGTPMYLIVNLALGGPAGDVDEGAFPVGLALDYVRVWQRDAP